MLITQILYVLNIIKIYLISVNNNLGDLEDTILSN